MAKTQTAYDELAATLEATGEYRVLRRLRRRPASSVPLDGHHVGLIVDTETTGLDTARDEVIELGLLAFSYSTEGEIGQVVAAYDGLRQPSVRMSEEAIAITGISPDLLAGNSLDDEAVSKIVERADLLIAHNAAFDRPMCERLLPVFRSKPWACSATEIPWQKRGFEGVKLTYLLTQSGFFNVGHRALDDCYSLLEVLDQRLNDGVLALSSLLQSARQTRFRIWVRSPYELRELLKRRGYRWNPGGNGRPRGWWLECDSETLSAELDFHSSIGLADGAISVERQTAFDRYKLVAGILPRA